MTKSMVSYDDNSVYVLIDDLTYLTPSQGCHTYSACSRECGNIARGGRVCEECRVNEIEDGLLKEHALLFLDSRRLQSEIADRMHSHVGGK